MPDDERNLRELEACFERAMDLPAERRGAEVRSAPERLRARLGALLESAAEAEVVLESPRWELAGSGAGEGGDRWRGGVPAGTRVGQFTIVEEIGRGGMGAVYRATQERPRREVAVKVLATPFPGEGALRRFEREGDVLARLQHPGIASIIEAGITRMAAGEVPFIAMELVDGVPITGVEVGGEGDRAGALGDRLEMLARVCDAVEYAHQRGVLHRDLKPPNVLVDRSGRPRVLDFGVARLLDREHEATVERAMVGTYAYMSPEQLLDGGGDTRSDVYSLGVMAWEVVCGEFPFGARPRTLGDAVRLAVATRSGQAGTPRTLRGDVAVVLCKAVAGDAGMRYQSAGALGEDLRRAAAGRPILARPPTLGYVASRYARRHAGVTAAGGIAAVAILALGSAVVVSGLEARREGRRAVEASQLAARRLELQRRFVGETLVQTSYAMLAIPGGYRVNGELLRKAVATLDELAADGADDPGLLCDLSGALSRLASAMAGDGTPNADDPLAAGGLIDRAEALARRACEIAPDSLSALAALEQAIWTRGSLPSGRATRAELRRESVALARRMYEEHGRTRALKSHLAYRLLTYGSHEGVLEALRESAALHEELLGEDPGDWEMRCATGTCDGALAKALIEVDVREAVAVAARAVALLSGCLAERPDNYSCARHLAFAEVTWARSLAAMGRGAEAGERCAIAFELVKQHANDPENTLHVADRALVCWAVVHLRKSLAHEYAPGSPERRAHLTAAIGVAEAVFESPPESTDVGPGSASAIAAELRASAAGWRAELLAAPVPGP